MFKYLTGNETHYGFNTFTTFNIFKIDPKLLNKTKIKIKVMIDAEKITITLTDVNGNRLANKKLTITVNGKTYTETSDFNGQIILKYKNARDFKVTAKFAGDEQYYKFECFTLKRTTTKLTIKVKGNKVIATLTDKNGNSIIGKKSYSDLKIEFLVSVSLIQKVKYQYTSKTHINTK